MNFATLKGLTIPEGAVTQIADASGRVLWKLETSKPVVLEVEKITANTTAGETTYENEQFVLMDIYPKTNGTVKVTYGGITKTITDTSGAAEPNARQVFFGTFNGVSDSVATPASGILIIEGQYSNFAAGAYNTKGSNKTTTKYCSCITAVNDWGDITSIKDYAFYECSNLALTSLPSGITSIGNCAFQHCLNITLSELPYELVSIGTNAFYRCYSLQMNDGFFKQGLTSIGSYAFDITQAKSDNFDPYALCESSVITIPSTVETIGSAAFRGPIIDGNSYARFKRVTVLATNPPTIDDSNYSAFGEKYSQLTIIVPKDCGETYKLAVGWSKYADCIVEAS